MERESGESRERNSGWERVRTRRERRESARLRTAEGSEWVRWFCSVLLLLLCSSHREREGGRGREREREGSMLRRDFNIPFGDSAKKTYIPLGFAYVEANNINI